MSSAIQFPHASLQESKSLSSSRRQRLRDILFACGIRVFYSLLHNFWSRMKATLRSIFAILSQVHVYSSNFVVYYPCSFRNCLKITSPTISHEIRLVSTTRSFTWCEMPKIFARNIFLLVAQFGTLLGFFLGQRLIPFVHEITVIFHHTGNSLQMSFSSGHTKFPNRGRTNTFLTCASEHYPANLRSVNAQLLAQSCLSNWKTGLEPRPMCNDIHTQSNLVN